MQGIEGEKGEEKKRVPKGATLIDIARDHGAPGPSPIVAARVNNELRELTYSLDEDASIEFLDLQTEDGMRIYQRSLVSLLVMAAREILAGCRVSVEHSLGGGLYGEIYWERPITERDIENIEARMREIVGRDVPFAKNTISKEEAIALFEKDGQHDKVRLLEYRKSPTINIYTCDWFSDYSYGYMVPSTGYLKLFRLRFYLPGFILEFPSRSDPTRIPEYAEQGKLASVFFEAERWGQVLNVSDVASLNDIVSQGNIGDIIRVAEAFHEKKIAKIADLITENRDRLRLVLIAGPSSSGKTTFAQRLAVQLRVNGLRPVSISLDDYFVDREHTPRDGAGGYDFEALEAIDLKLFNEHLTRLIQGEEVELPTFNFLKGKREFTGRRLRIRPDQPVIIEGIHGLNDRLTLSIPKSRKFKIYVSALTQLNIDNHNRIPTTDVRLLRRIVRDSQFRSHSALETIRLWPNVRRGEERNIFPFQEEADIMFNSALAYELAVLKKYAEPLLEAIDRSVPEYSEAKRLLKFLDYFLEVDPGDVPANSLLREFIGGSCFA
ncbi:MAG: nucleoside kinase [Firmicutes bacterium]|nr:nucleoside kinase [Bacillota bacterium]